MLGRTYRQLVWPIIGRHRRHELLQASSGRRQAGEHAGGLRFGRTIILLWQVRACIDACATGLTRFFRVRSAVDGLRLTLGGAQDVEAALQTCRDLQQVAKTGTRPASL